MSVYGAGSAVTSVLRGFSAASASLRW